jgi:hypothetical protein
MDVQGSETEVKQQTGKELAVSNKCAYVREDGSRCKANSLKGESFCFFHSTSVMTKRLEAQSLGGRRRHSQGVGSAYKIESARDVPGILIDTLNQSTSLPTSAAKARAIAYLVSTLLKSLELASLEDRVTALEQRVEGKG